MQKNIDHLGLGLYCALIFWLSSQETLPTPMLFENQDKAHHLLAYFGMGILCWRSFNHFITVPIILAISSVLFCSLYGISDEWHQSFVPGRMSGADDWLADTTGAILAQFFMLKYARQVSAFAARYLFLNS